MIAVLQAALPCEETGEVICHAVKVADTPKLDDLRGNSQPTCKDATWLSQSCTRAPGLALMHRWFRWKSIFPTACPTLPSLGCRKPQCAKAANASAVPCSTVSSNFHSNASPSIWRQSNCRRRVAVSIWRLLSAFWRHRDSLGWSCRITWYCSVSWLCQAKCGE